MFLMSFFACATLRDVNDPLAAAQGDYGHLVLTHGRNLGLVAIP